MEPEFLVTQHGGGGGGKKKKKKKRRGGGGGGEKKIKIKTVQQGFYVSEETT